MTHDPDFGPRPRGRAGAEISSRRTLLVVLAVTLVVAVAVVVLVRRGHHAPPTCTGSTSTACVFADRFTVTGYRLAHRNVAIGRTAVANYYVGPPSTDPVKLVSAPGLVLSAPTSPMGETWAPVIGVGASTDPAYVGCAVLVYQLAKAPPGVLAADDAAALRAGRLALLETGLTCPS